MDVSFMNFEKSSKLKLLRPHKNILSIYKKDARCVEIYMNSYHISFEN